MNFDVNDLMGEDNDILQVITAEGGELRDTLIELNQNYAETQRDTDAGETKLAALDSIRNRIIDQGGVDRASMAAVESFVESMALSPYTPLGSYTQRPSPTNMKVALEEIDTRRAAVGVGIAVVVMGVLYKLVKWAINWFKNRKDGGAQVTASVTRSIKDADVIDEMAKKANVTPEHVMDKAKGEKVDKVMQTWNDGYTQFEKRCAERPHLFDLFEKVFQSMPALASYIEAGLKSLIEYGDWVIDVIESGADVDKVALVTKNASVSWVEEKPSTNDWPELEYMAKSINRNITRRIDKTDTLVNEIKKTLEDMSNQKVAIRRNQTPKVITELNRAFDDVQGPMKTCDDIKASMIERVEKIDALNEKLIDIITAIEQSKNIKTELMDCVRKLTEGLRFTGIQVRSLTGVTVLYQWCDNKIVDFYRRVVGTTQYFIMGELKAEVTTNGADISEFLEKVKDNREEERRAFDAADGSNK